MTKLSRWTLPAFEDKRLKWPVGIFTIGLIAFVYGWTNRHPLMQPLVYSEAQSFFAFDRFIPFLPWTGWIYASFVPYLLISFIPIRNSTVLNALLYSMVALVLVSVGIFSIFPTEYPRALYPIPEGADSWNVMIMKAVRWLDQPTNAAPSLHVGMAFVLAFAALRDPELYRPIWFREIRGIRGSFIFWSALMSLSTLTVKQHSILDVISGFMLAAAISWFFMWKARYKSFTSPESQPTQALF